MQWFNATAMVPVLCSGEAHRISISIRGNEMWATAGSHHSDADLDVRDVAQAFGDTMSATPCVATVDVINTGAAVAWRNVNLMSTFGRRDLTHINRKLVRPLAAVVFLSCTVGNEAAALQPAQIGSTIRRHLSVAGPTQVERQTAVWWESWLTSGAASTRAEWVSAFSPEHDVVSQAAVEWFVANGFTPRTAKNAWADLAAIEEAATPDDTHSPAPIATLFD